MRAASGSCLEGRISGAANGWVVERPTLPPVTRVIPAQPCAKGRYVERTTPQLGDKPYSIRSVWKRARLPEVHSPRVIIQSSCGPSSAVSPCRRWMFYLILDTSCCTMLGLRGFCSAEGSAWKNHGSHATSCTPSPWPGQVSSHGGRVA